MEILFFEIYDSRIIRLSTVAVISEPVTTTTSVLLSTYIGAEAITFWLGVCNLPIDNRRGVNRHKWEHRYSKSFQLIEQ